MAKARIVGTCEAMGAGPASKGAPTSAEAGAAGEAEVRGVTRRHGACGPMLRRASAEAGMTTAEYAVGTLAACGFAGLLLKVLTSGGMATLLRHLVERALAVAG